MLTENSAKNMWCPFARVADGSGALINRDWDGFETEGFCIASRCMAWRWEDRLHERGYCGLAGKPVVP